jgi:hypothetical protein
MVWCVEAKRPGPKITIPGTYESISGSALTASGHLPVRLAGAGRLTRDNDPADTIPGESSLLGNDRTIYGWVQCGRRCFDNDVIRRELAG